MMCQFQTWLTNNFKYSSKLRKEEGERGGKKTALVFLPFVSFSL